jgi:hypothetical protein
VLGIKPCNGMDSGGDDTQHSKRGYLESIHGDTVRLSGGSRCLWRCQYLIFTLHECQHQPVWYAGCPAKSHH